jgi:gamma-glutamylcyclotransferase (GGCT)/AIG2-like uncharacterized protein YtfP
MMIEFIFVYGTLRRVSGTAMSAQLVRYSEFISEATMQGLLYEIDGYPGAIESTDPSDKVSGELYKILDIGKLLPFLDEYEECSAQFPLPHEYLRKAINISQQDGSQLIAWVYIYNRDVTGLKQLNRHYPQ